MKQCQLREDRRIEILLNSGTPEAEAHFSVCGSCAEALAGHAELWKALDAWDVPEVSRSFNRELFAKIDAEEIMPWHQRFSNSLKGIFAQPSLALAAAALVVLCGFVLDHPAARYSPQVAYAPAVQVSNTEAEQVEKTLDDLDMLRQFDVSTEEKETTSKSM